MDIIYKPAANYYSPWQMKESKIQAVCLHGTSGAAAGALSWLTSKQSGVSSNYLVTKLGDIYNLVDWRSGRRAWANGKIDIYDATIKWLDDAVKRGINPNWITVSIEHEASFEDMAFHRSMTDRQFNASIELTAAVLVAAGLKANHDTIIAHCQICAKAKPNCPGVIFVPAYLEQLLIRHPELK